MNQRPTINLDNYKNVNNLSVDMAVHGIIHERKRGLWPEKVMFAPPYFKLFENWVAQSWGEEYLGADYYIDTVKIEKQFIKSKEILIFEYAKPKETD